MPVVEAGRIPRQLNLKLYAGDSASFGLTLSDGGVPIDATVGQWAAQIKPEGFAEIVEGFDVSVDAETPGRVVLSIDADVSQRLGEYRQKLRWDLQQTFNDSTVTTHLQGFLVMSPDVTRITLDLTFLVTDEGDALVTDLGEVLVA